MSWNAVVGWILGDALGGFGWLIPLLGLVFMVVMILVCMRRMGGLWRCGCLHSSHPPAAPEIETLRREIQGLREELHRRRGSA